MAGASGLLLSRIIKSSQLVTCMEAHQRISPVSSVKLEHNKSKLWQILIISFPTTFFSWPLFYSDSRSILGTTQAVIQSMYIVPCISQHVPPWYHSGTVLIQCFLLCLCFPNCHGSLLIHPTLTLQSSQEWQDCHFEEMEASRS